MISRTKSSSSVTNNVILTGWSKLLSPKQSKNSQAEGSGKTILRVSDSRIGFPNFGMNDILDRLIPCCACSSCAIQDTQQHPWPLPADKSSKLPILPPGTTTKNVSRHCQMFFWGEDDAKSPHGWQPLLQEHLIHFVHAVLKLTATEQTRKKPSYALLSLPS